MENPYRQTLISKVKDVLVTLSHYLTFQRTLRPCYAGYVISTVYLFMPLEGFLQPFLLGCSVSLLYAADFAIVTKSAEQSRATDFALLVPDLFFLVGLNMLGIFNRWRREIVTRIVFLTKRQTLEQSLIWQYAKDQEKSLLVSIIPEPIAKTVGQEIKYRIEKAKVGALTEEGGRKLFIESHEDVSILFADLVNFTFLTTQLDVKRLVEILHDLFQRFDKACKTNLQKFNVMRIKFLGDCYYGVSGVPVSHPLHSVCCIELGRSIINNVREVRAINKVDIDMRVGIHSGSLLAGIIGSSKWQYDIWSTDVNIANCLESTGSPGRVHISKATLTLADGYYICEEGTERAKADPTLLKYNITTFLIIEPSWFPDLKAKMNSSAEWQNYLQSKEEASASFHNLETVDANLSEAYQLDYQEVVDRARELMEQEIENLPICKLEPYHLDVSAIKTAEYRAHSAVTESLCLYVALALSWPRIPFLLSLVLTIPLLIVYIIMVFTEFSLVYEASISTNVGASAEFAHIWGLLIICYIHILIARHIIFISKFNYLAASPDVINETKTKINQSIYLHIHISAYIHSNRCQLQEKIDNSNVTNESIRVLLHNILPAHVVQIYLTKRLQNEPFYEQHDYAAVMFATVIHKRTDSMDLRLMNEIICDFDEVLSFYKYPLKVEKIKVINWTYMAACGLSAKGSVLHGSLQSIKSVFVPNRYPRKGTIQRLTTFSLASAEPEKPSLEKMRSKTPSPPESVSSSHYDSDDDDSDSENDRDFHMHKSSVTHKDRVVQVLANFALDFLKVVKSFNESMQKARNFDKPPIELRIGISSGEVMAGVVGSSQAHYDIWGNAVNMAARMDTTGEPGRIQVTEETAEVLRSFDIGCTYRGLTAVKGRGSIPTYFINVDEEFRFQEQ
uniref:adenylate cyclase n=1 Tax=Glossina pallidipes TaxID=7398 RepID=A0A1B0AET2_GLOPL